MHARYWQYYEIQYIPGLDLAFPQLVRTKTSLCQGTFVSKGNVQETTEVGLIFASPSILHTTYC
jgi:hypothetical protein